MDPAGRRPADPRAAGRRLPRRCPRVRRSSGPGRWTRPAAWSAGCRGTGAHLALTIDDGTNTEVVAAFIALAARTGIRLTFFPNGRYRSWQDNAAALRPLVDSGQVALGNHTWSHPDVTTLDDRALTEEIRRNQQFLWTTFGVRNAVLPAARTAPTTRAPTPIAADLGHPTIALWNGTLDDCTVADRRPSSGRGAAVVHRRADRHRPRQPPAGDHRVRRAAGADRASAGCAR